MTSKLSVPIPIRSDNVLLDSIYCGGEGYLTALALNAMCVTTVVRPIILTIGLMGVALSERLFHKMLEKSLSGLMLKSFKIFKFISIIPSKILSFSLAIFATCKILQLVGMITVVPLPIFLLGLLAFATLSLCLIIQGMKGRTFSSHVGSEVDNTKTNENLLNTNSQTSNTSMSTGSSSQLPATPASPSSSSSSTVTPSTTTTTTKELPTTNSNTSDASMSTDSSSQLSATLTSSPSSSSSSSSTDVPSTTTTTTINNDLLNTDSKTPSNTSMSTGSSSQLSATLTSSTSSSSSSSSSTDVPLVEKFKKYCERKISQFENLISTIEGQIGDLKEATEGIITLKGISEADALFALHYLSLKGTIHSWKLLDKKEPPYKDNSYKISKQNFVTSDKEVYTKEMIKDIAPIYLKYDEVVTLPNIDDITCQVNGSYKVLRLKDDNKRFVEYILANKMKAEISTARGLEDRGINFELYNELPMRFYGVGPHDASLLVAFRDQLLNKYLESDLILAWGCCRDDYYIKFSESNKFAREFEQTITWCYKGNVLKKEAPRLILKF